MQVVRGLPRSPQENAGPSQVFFSPSGGGLGAAQPRGQPDLGGCALTIGNFDGVHRGHQAMLALLVQEARQRGLSTCALTFEPHPRDFFSQTLGKPELAPSRVATLRDSMLALADCGIDRCVVLRFDQRLASLSPQAFIDQVLVTGLRARWVLVGDDFRFGAKRAGDVQLLQAAGRDAGFEVAQMASFAINGHRVSSSAVRQALVAGDMHAAEQLLGRPYTVSGHVLHGQKLGRELGFRTLNQRFNHPRPAAMGIFVSRVHGLGPTALPAVSSLGVRPTVVDQGRVLLETHCLHWPASLGSDAAYGRCVRVELLHKLHDERRYDSLDALREGIARDTADAQAWHAAQQVREPSATTG